MVVIPIFVLEVLTMGDFKKKFINITNLLRNSINNEMVEISWGGYQYKIKYNREEIKKTSLYAM